MKKLLIPIISILVITGCTKEKTDSLPEDVYTGYFNYQGIDYWYSVEFKDNKYTEWPSGGMYNQKGINCLTVGSFTITDNKIIFELDSFKYGQPEGYNCSTDLTMPGEYTLNSITGDSISFEKGTGDNRITYYLKRSSEVE